MQDKKFVISLGIFFVSFLCFFFVQSRAMEQYSGTATRMSGTLERDYGWNLPQVYFEPSLFHKHVKLADYTKPVDLVVLGDSFSYGDQSWIYYLMRNQGISVHFFHIENVSVSELLNHKVFRESPPGVMIVCSWEGWSFLRFGRFSSEFDKIAPMKLLARSTTEPMPPPGIQKYEKSRDKSLLFDERMALTGDYLKKKFIKLVFKNFPFEASVVEIECESCFSNSLQGSFLATTSTIDPIPYSMTARETLFSNLKRLKSIVEANGQTRFYSTIFPHKINVYLPYTDIETNKTFFDGDIPENEIGFINLMPGLQKAVADGTQDVYLPNDHHFGSAGFKVTAEIISDAVYE